MLSFYAKIYLQTLAACWSTFGIGKWFFRLLLIRPTHSTFNKITLFFDNLFFPSYRHIKIEKPVFIIAHPRSGTTFLHQILTQTNEFVIFTFWEAIFPSICGRKIVTPLKNLLIKKGRDTILPPKTGHEIKLDRVEEEETLFYHISNTQLLTFMTPLGFSAKDFIELVFSDHQSPHIRTKTMCFLKQCFQRHIYYLNKQRIIAKMNYSGMRIQSLLETFPDAKIVYIVRSPYETISSHLSLHRNIFDYIWGLDSIPEDKLQRYFARRYKHNVEYYKYIEKMFLNGILNSLNCLVISYESLKIDLAKTIEAIVGFTGIEISAELREKIQHQIQKERNYQSNHQNLALGEFGLTKERIVKDLSFVFEKYGFKR